MTNVKAKLLYRRDIFKRKAKQLKNPTTMGAEVCHCDNISNTLEAIPSIAVNIVKPRLNINTVVEKVCLVCGSDTGVSESNQHLPDM